MTKSKKSETEQKKQKLQELSNLRNRLFKGGSKRDQIFTYCELMQYVGGYEQMMNLPVTAVGPIIEYIKYKNKKMKPKRGKKR